MSHNTIPRIPLSVPSKASIPVLGCGTAADPFGSSNEKVRESVLHAIKIGYRHFDTAAIYGSEPPLGEAIQEALRLGLINSRDELFVTSKLWCADAHHSRVIPAIQKTLRNLKLDYVDLYLIHMPVSLKPGEPALPIKKEELLPMDFKSVWENMEECQKLRYAKSIGVSNFSDKKLDALLSTATIPPAVNQVEMNPLWRQEKLRIYCKEKGIHVSAYSALGGRGAIWGSDWVMDCPILKEVAHARKKSVAQVCLRWVYEQGVSVIVKSFNKERIKENLDIFDWELTPEDNEKISQIPQRKSSTATAVVWERGPFKTVEELWDEKID